MCVDGVKEMGFKVAVCIGVILVYGYVRVCVSRRYIITQFIFMYGMCVVE